MPYWIYIGLYTTMRATMRKENDPGFPRSLRYIDVKISLSDLNSRTVQVSHAYEVHVGGKS